MFFKEIHKLWQENSQKKQYTLNFLTTQLKNSIYSDFLTPVYIVKTMKIQSNNPMSQFHCIHITISTTLICHFSINNFIITSKEKQKAITIFKYDIKCTCMKKIKQQLCKVSNITVTLQFL